MYGLTHSDEKRFRDGEMAETMREVERDTHTHTTDHSIYFAKAAIQ